jgi:hypothetical protein
MEGMVLETIKADGRIYCGVLYITFVPQEVKAHKPLLSLSDCHYMLFPHASIS